jgi:hypothetical protein
MSSPQPSWTHSRPTAIGSVLSRAELAVAKHIDDDIRITRVAWLEPNAETAMLYERVTQVVRRLNDEIYHFDVTGLENIQYSVYHGSEGGNYQWHIDHGPHDPRPRKDINQHPADGPGALPGLRAAVSGQREDRRSAHDPWCDHRLSLVLPAPRDADRLGRAQGTGDLGDRTGISLTVTSTSPPLSAPPAPRGGWRSGRDSAAG